MHAKVFTFENKLYVLILLNSSSPVDIVNKGGGEMKSNAEEGDCDMDDGSQADEGSSYSEGVDANKLSKSWEKYEDSHKLER